MPDNDLDFDIDYLDRPQDGQGVDPIAKTEPVVESAPAPEPAPVSADPAPVAKTSPDAKTPEPVIKDIVDPAPVVKVEEPTDDTETPLWKEIAEKIGYDLGDTEYEDSPEGIVKMTREMSERMATEQLDSIFEKFPSVQRHLDYVMNGGEPERMLGIERETDWSTAKVDSAEAQKDVLRAYFKARGDNDEMANDMIEVFEDKKTLAAKAEGARQALAQHQEQRKEALAAEQRKIAAQRQKEAEESWNHVKKVVTESNDLHGIPLTEKERGKFMDYISKPVTREGYTQRDLDAQKMTVDKQLALDLILFRNFDLGKVVDTKAKTVAAANLRDRLKADSGRATNKQARQSTPGSGSDVTFGSIDDLV